MSSFPKIPPDTPKALRNFLESLREQFEIIDGTRGAPLDSSPSWQDLLDVGFLKANPNLVLKSNGKSFTASDITNWVSLNMPDWTTATQLPQVPHGLVVSASASSLVLTWDAWESLYYGQTLIYRAGANDLNQAVLIGSTTGTTYVDSLPPTGVVYYYWIRNETKNKLQSDFNDVNGTTVTNVVAQPNLHYVFDGSDVVISWPTPTSNLTIQYYQVTYGDAIETSLPVGVSNTNTMVLPVNWIGDRKFWVRGVDVQNQLGLPSSIVVDVLEPLAPVVNQTVQNDALVLLSNSTERSLPIAKYEVRYGSSFDIGTQVFIGQSNRFETAVNWTGSRTFWVMAYDTAGNSSPATQSIFSPTPPSVVQPSVEIVDNTVLLRWSASTGTLSIAKYKVYRNGVLYTTVQGLFATVIEQISGTFTYGISGVDSAGNEGSITTVVGTVTQPPDFVLFSSVDTTFAGTKTNAFVEADGSLTVNVDTSESWATHFSSRGWTNIDDQIAAGYTQYAVGKTTGSYTEDVDYTATIPSTNIYLTVNKLDEPNGTVSVGLTIATGTNGTTFPNSSSSSPFYSTGFRYVRYSLAFSASHDGSGLATDTNKILRIKANYRLDLRLKTKEYSVNAVSTDTGGTTLNITGDFVDVQAITATVISSSFGVAVIDFTDVANPTSMKVLAYNSSGTRISATVNVIVRGV